MEVHHHPHVEKKRFKEYFFEFLMIFLAVTLGFFAENIRERITEHERAKEYAKSFVGDIEIDTGELNRGLQQTRFLIESIDSITSISSRWDKRPVVPGDFYFYSRFVSYTYTIDWSRSTIDQLIQSGNLRYFKNKDLVGEINYYYYSGGFMQTEYQRDFQLMGKVTECRNKILLGRYYSVFSDMSLREESQSHIPSAKIDSLRKLMLPLQPDAADQMDEYINYLSERKQKLLVNFDYYSNALKLATDLMETLKKEYHLK